MLVGALYEAFQGRGTGIATSAERADCRGEVQRVMGAVSLILGTRWAEKGEGQALQDKGSAASALLTFCLHIFFSGGSALLAGGWCFSGAFVALFDCRR